MNKKPIIFLLLLAMILPQATYGFAIEEPLALPQQEQRAKELFYDIRCVVCQGESVAESSAKVAQDMRRAIRDQVASGKGSDEIKAFLVSRYGDQILMKPPFRPYTALLWLGPLLLLLLGFMMVRSYFSKEEIEGSDAS